MILEHSGTDRKDRDCGESENSIKRRQESAGLVRKMMSGDQAAFDSLMTMYYSKALHIAYLISGNRPDSEDIVQETFVLCWINRKKIREPEYFETWLFKTLTREAWRFCKRARKEPPVEEVFGEDKTSPVDVMEEAMKNWEAGEIYRAVKELPVKQRTVIVLYYYNQMSTKEIAHVMNCLEGTVKSRLFTARASLKKVLEEETYTFRKEIPQ
ncbi:sigma-70 family RNA polymerase sigma factor [Clostridium sp. MCC353]|uniref:RNA polymerase sigma factor n=1 Tax=Clostridium sp. MCC353 TaxID=2592646 RepID=UPI001C0268AF|nr:RNA polymerase sigma factor [Clostridium sp. MCC353]MBT9778573.1 sigma-70 family RNA polymerase sigma factor [Clostridium sp. MCC353]